MSRKIIATTALVLAIAFILYRFIPVPGVSAGSGGGSTNVTLTLQFQGTGTVNLNPPNQPYTSGTTRSYALGTVVNLSASAPAGWRFHHWENALTGTSSTGSITMTSTKTVKAVFVQCKLTVNKQGNGQVKIEAPGQTTETLTPTFAKTYSGITTVTLTAIPDAGWAFKEWTGDHTGTSSPATVLVDQEKTVTAVFEQIKLTVNKAGEGQVKIEATGQTTETLTPTFTKTYSGFTTVTLTAIPNTGWAFKEWTGNHTGTSSPATVLVDREKTVTAVFEQIKLTVNKTGEGQVKIEATGQTTETLTPTFTKTYSGIATVTLTAIPDTGWAFKEWTGNHTGTSSPATVLVDREKTVTAVFEQIKLTVNKTGEGQVWTDGPVGGLRTPPFTESFEPGATVMLTAVPAEGWGFKEWTGDLEATSSTTTLEMDGEKTVTAVFAQVELTVNKEGEGTVGVNPPGGVQNLPFTETYGMHTPVSVYAVPVGCSTFLGWSGDIPIGQSQDNPLSIAMYADKAVTAHFSGTGSGETTTWAGPQAWDTLGYAGDQFSHQIMAPCINVGDQVIETIIYDSDTMGGLTGNEKAQLAASGGHTWNVVAGKWRSSDDHHWINYNAYPTIKNYIDTVGAVGTLTLKQEMRKVGSNDVYATHVLVYKFVRVAPNGNCNPDYSGALCHVFVQKSGKNNPTLWPNLPSVPCPP